MNKAILILLATSLVAFQAPTCEAFVFDFLSNALTVTDYVKLGLDLITKVTYKTEMAESEDETYKLLNQISKNINKMKNTLKGNFSAIIEEIKNIPSTVWQQETKGAFEDILNEITDSFKRLVKKQVEINQNISWISESEVIIVSNYETSLENSWDKFRHYLFEKHVIDYLKMQGANNVCESGISQFQLVEESLYQFLIVANQYMLSRHIIYNIREHIDEKNYDRVRRRFNHELKYQLDEDLEKFKTAMSESSTEYWRCNPTETINILYFMPELIEDRKQGSSDCEEIQNSGYQCIPSHNNRKCDCIKSTMIISLALATADPGYVITGAQIKIDGSVLTISAKQGKLLPGGLVDKNTIKDVTEKKIPPGQPAQAEFVLRASKIEFGQVTIPTNRFITGVGFHMRFLNFIIAAESTKYDTETKTLVNSNTQIHTYSYTNSVSDTKFARAIEVFQPNNIRWKDNIYPLIDSQMVQSSSPSPLSGIGLFLRGKSEKDGFVAIKINTYNTASFIPQIPSLNDFPVREVLNSLSNTTSLSLLKKKFGA